MIKAIIGLGNPGQLYAHNRHNIGFKVLETLAEKANTDFRTRPDMELAEFRQQESKVLLIKPQTFMNNSGRVIAYLTKQGIKPEEILVVHDELELSFGKIALKQGGSAKGHNGLKSIIAACGDNFYRLRIGISHPTDREQVPNYVLSNFSEPAAMIEQVVAEAVTKILTII